MQSEVRCAGGGDVAAAEVVSVAENAVLVEETFAPTAEAVRVAGAVVMIPDDYRCVMQRMETSREEIWKVLENLQRRCEALQLSLQSVDARFQVSEHRLDSIEAFYTQWAPTASNALWYPWSAG